MAPSSWKLFKWSPFFPALAIPAVERVATRLGLAPRLATFLGTTHMSQFQNHPLRRQRRVPVQHRPALPLDKLAGYPKSTLWMNKVILEQKK
jgi:hypothetical protein